MTAIKSFADEFIQHAIDKDIDKAKKQMGCILQIFMEESFSNGHYNKIQSIFQSSFESKINCNKNYNMILSIQDFFLCKDIKSSTKLFAKLGMKFINFKQWFSKQRSTYAEYKNNYIDIDGQRQFRFTSDVWVGSTKNKYDNPNKVLGHKFEQSHVRPIFQMMLHPNYTIYGGGDCNGENPGNTHGKHGRVLESIFSHIAKEYRKRSYIAGLYYNEVQCNFTSKNDGDFNPSMYWIRKDKILAGCMPITGLFILIRNWSYVQNYEKINEIYYKHFMDIYNNRKCSARQFMSKYKKELDIRVRLPIMKVIEETSIELMDHIWSRTQQPLFMRESNKKIPDDMQHIQARTFGGLKRKSKEKKPERKKLDSKMDRINSKKEKKKSLNKTIRMSARCNHGINESDLDTLSQITSDDSLSDNEQDTEDDDNRNDNSDNEENTEDDDIGSDDSDIEENKKDIHRNNNNNREVDDSDNEEETDDTSLKHAPMKSKKKRHRECVVPMRSKKKNGPGRSRIKISLDINVTLYVPRLKKLKH